MSVRTCMFAGIIEAQKAIISTRAAGKCVRVRVAKPQSWNLSQGESVSIDGICSTIVAKSSASFDVEYMPETLSKTTAVQFQAKRMVNLERSLRYGDRIHGHFVAGHVDAASRVARVDRKGRSRVISIKTPPEVSNNIVARGSIAVNGVSLTVAKKGRGFFSVALILHTLAKTNLVLLREGDIVNIEADMLARYRGGGRVSIHAKKQIRR